MNEPADLRIQASMLRRAGFSYSQIGRRLGVHKSVIARWVCAVPFDGFNAESRAEQISAVRDPQLYNRALELRQAGWSYKMIEHEIGVARSTLSGWLRNVPVAEYDARVQERALAAQREAVEANKRRQEALEQQARAAAGETIRRLCGNGLSDRELFFVGLMLYWAEGSKTHGHVGITNSDPGLVKTFAKWATYSPGVSREQLRGTVHTHPDIDIAEAETYWSVIIGIPRTQFFKAQIDQRMDKSVQKHGKLPFGTVHVTVAGNGTGDLHRKIMGWIAAFSEYTGE